MLLLRRRIHAEALSLQSRTARRWSFAALVALAALAAPGLAQPAPAPAGEPVSPAVVRRTTLVVNDIDASIRFYRDVLGFSPRLDNRGRVAASSLPSGLSPGSPSRFVLMQGPDPWLGALGLLQYGPAKPLPAPAPALHPGDVVLTIETHEVEAVFGRMQASGVRVLRAPETSELPGPDGRRWTTTFMFAYDPDGRLIEVSSRQPEATKPAQEPVP